MKDSITHQEYLQLQGLLTLAERHVRRADEIRDAIAEIIGDKGRAEDAIWGYEDFSADALLGRSGIEVTDAD